MAFAVCGGATCSCSFGTAPSNLNITPANKVTTKMPIATIMDKIPMVNIVPFGMCSSMSNPQVAAATSAAMGTLTPMPCMPNITAPWAPGSKKLLISNKPALTNSSKVQCMWGGVITIVNPGQQNISIP